MNPIIATDLDGTLLGSDTEISRENLDALERLYKRGVRFVALTGRTFFEIPKPLRESPAPQPPIETSTFVPAFCRRILFCTVRMPCAKPSLKNGTYRPSRSCSRENAKNAWVILVKSIAAAVSAVRFSAGM